MAIVVKDRVKVTTTTTGTSDLPSAPLRLGFKISQLLVTATRPTTPQLIQSQATLKSALARIQPLGLRSPVRLLFLSLALLGQRFRSVLALKTCSLRT